MSEIQATRPAPLLGTPRRRVLAAVAGVLVLVAAAVVYLVANGLSLEAAKPTAMLTVTGGRAAVFRLNHGESQVSGSFQLRSDDRVTTPAAVTALVTYGDGSITRIGPDSVININIREAAGGRTVTFWLDHGKVWIDPRGGTTDYVAQSPGGARATGSAVFAVLAPPATVNQFQKPAQTVYADVFQGTVTAVGARSGPAAAGVGQQLQLLMDGTAVVGAIPEADLADPFIVESRR